MDTDEHLNALMKNIDMDMVHENLEDGKPFPLMIGIADAQSVLEACGLIFNPKDGTYQSLEEGDRWKAQPNEQGGVMVFPSPVLYDTTAAEEINAPIGSSKELDEDKLKMDGMDLDSPEGTGMDAPSKPA